ncbi:hypothetical protein IT400_03710 [Candidatus Nomurabacteria bacterium]|nr:hypothetical protein [Candidatus Nomurabacteria bacterium]
MSKINENRMCQNCKGNFVIEPDDFSFYEKIKVPPPTFCPECRMIRRMVWRNVRSLYKRECGLCKKVLISMYSDDGAPVYCTDCWSGDNWDPLSYGSDYDFSKSFFTQLYSLFKVAPRFFVYHTGMLVNSDFTNYSADNKNVYLSYSVISCEDVMYSESIDKSKNCIDCYAVQKLDGCSQNIDSEGNYNVHYAVKSQNSIDSYFIYDCINCQNCCLSSNLRNKQFYFKNQKLSKEEYQQVVINLQLDSCSGLQRSKEYFDDMMQNQAIHRYAQIYNSQDATGDYIGNSRNIIQSFDVHDSENVKYGARVVVNTKDSMDVYGLGTGELVYESLASSWGTYKVFFSYIALASKECEYCFIMRNCSNCFGCVGLTNAKYCIFNKQYTREEYFIMVEKIKKHMDEMPYTDSKNRVYKYGEFLPYEMSPFGYNETTAHDLYSTTKEKALQSGYKWTEREKRDYVITKNSQDLPDSITDVDDDLVHETILCPNNGEQTFQCTSAFKITPDELQFYKQKKLPVPLFCPNCRHYDRLNYRNSMRLYKRTCSNGCGNIFESTYASDRPEKVYCESCYKKEVL